MTVGELGEHELIKRLSLATPLDPQSVPIGIGDDAAVVKPERGTLTVVTTDGLLEDVHFNRDFVSGADIGHKALAVNISDLAAMGATPRHALLSLALPSTLPVCDFDALLNSLLNLATQHHITLIGGNITRTNGPLFVDVTAIGSVKRRRVLTRSGALAGDEIYVSGKLGGAAAGLDWLQKSTNEQRASNEQMTCRQKYLRPDPRVGLGTLLSRNRVTRACIDLSDGLSDGIKHLASASGVGVVLEAEKLPIQPEARAWFEITGIDPVMATLAAGDDYELLFTVPKKFLRRLASVQKLVKGLSLTRIGRVTKDSRLLLKHRSNMEELPKGYEHFR